MRADQRVIDVLNEVLGAELGAVNQYFLNAKMLENWGFAGLAKTFRERSLDEMRDAESLMARILFLEGVPNVARLESIRIGQNPIEQLRYGLDLEYAAVARLHRGVATCVEVGDWGTREYLAAMITDEEAHADWYETQLDAVERLGEQLYLAQQLA